MMSVLTPPDGSPHTSPDGRRRKTLYLPSVCTRAQRPSTAAMIPSRTSPAVRSSEAASAVRGAVVGVGVAVAVGGSSVAVATGVGVGGAGVGVG